MIFQVVERLKSEILTGLNSTFTEADWPKGTKRGDSFNDCNKCIIILCIFSGWPSNFDGYISPGWCKAK